MIWIGGILAESGGIDKISPNGDDGDQSTSFCGSDAFDNETAATTHSLPQILKPGLHIPITP
jgi:hypothetical protein